MAKAKKSQPPKVATPKAAPPKAAPPRQEPVVTEIVAAPEPAKEDGEKTMTAAQRKKAKKK